MTFTEKQQKEHREDFIAQCRQKAWDAACNADFISKNIDQLLADYRKLQDEDKTLAADIKELDGALDYHTVENRNKRKALQERRNAIGPQIDFIAKTAQDGQRAMQQLLNAAENNLALAKHAETWEWKEVETAKGL
jgi:hypothetical protein